jgi:hypothetical protein
LCEKFEDTSERIRTGTCTPFIACKILEVEGPSLKKNSYLFYNFLRPRDFGSMIVFLGLLRRKYIGNGKIIFYLIVCEQQIKN